MHQGLTEFGRGDRFENDGEELWIELTDVTQGNSCGDLDSFEPLHVLLALRYVEILLLFVLIGLHQENVEHLLDSFLVSEPMTRRSTLGANILKSLTSIEPDDLISFLLVKALHNDVNGIVTEFPNWICHLIIKLSGCIEHVLSKSSNGSSSHPLITVSKSIDELTCDINLGKLIFDDSGMSDQKADNRANSDLNHR